MNSKYFSFGIIITHLLHRLGKYLLRQRLDSCSCDDCISNGKIEYSMSIDTLVALEAENQRRVLDSLTSPKALALQTQRIKDLNEELATSKVRGSQ